MTTIATHHSIYVPFGNAESIGSKDDDTYTYTELPVDRYVGEAANFDNLVKAVDDWNVSAADKRASATAELREDMAYMASAGVDWWGSISLSGFGPTAANELGTEAVPAYDGTEVITTIPPVDTDVVREAAEMPTPASHGGRVSSASTYRDWMTSARITAPDEDDAFTAEGFLQWEQLDEYDAVDKVDNMQAWWV